MSKSVCDVLALGAHPDDVELTVGGTLLLARDRGMRIVICHATAGEMGTRGSTETRRREAEAAADALGAAEMEILGMPDGRVAVNDENKDILIRAIRRHRPRLVLAPHTHDLHPDHEAVGELMRKCWFLAGLEKWDTGQEPWRPDGMLRYMSHSTFTPTIIVDITETIDAKEEAARSYASQFHDPASTERETYISGDNFWEWWRARASYWGHFIGVRYGEPFAVDGPIPTRDPFTFFAGFGKYKNG